MSNMKRNTSKLAGLTILVLALLILSIATAIPVLAVSTVEVRYLSSTLGDSVGYSAIPINEMIVAHTYEIWMTAVVIGGVLVLVVAAATARTIYEHVGRKPPYAIGGFNGSLDLNNNTSLNNDYAETLGVYNMLVDITKNTFTAVQSIIVSVYEICRGISASPSGEDFQGTHEAIQISRRIAG